MTCDWPGARKCPRQNMGKDLRAEKTISPRLGDMSEDKDALESLLSRAKEQERQYDWGEAAKSIEEALVMSQDMSPERDGELLERMAHDTSRSAFQGSTNEAFRKLLGTSIGQFRKAIEAYKRSPNANSNALATRCEAMCSYLSYWLETDLPKKKRVLKESWEAMRGALAAFSESKDYLNLALTYNRLHFSAFLGWYYEESHETRSTILSDLIRYGNEAVENLVPADLDAEESARALVNLTSSIDSYAIYHPMSAEEWRRYQQRGRQGILRATELSMEAATSEAIYGHLSLGSYLSLGDSDTDYLGIADDEDFERRGAKKLLDFAEKTRDRLSQGLAHSYVASRLDWIGASLEVPEDSERLRNLALEHSAETRRHFACLGFVAPDFLWWPWPSAPVVPWYYHRLYNRETDLGKKRTLATRLLSEARDFLRFSESSGYPLAVGSSRWIVAVALDAVADTEGDDRKSMALVKEALEHFRAAKEALDTFAPSHLWNTGLARINCARIEYKLVGLMKDGVDRTALAESSATHFREGLGQVHEWTTVWNEETFAADKTHRCGLGIWWNWYGRALRTEFEILGDRSFLKSAIEAFEKAAEEAAKGGWESRAAENLWDAARTSDLLEEYSKASKGFENASACYTKAAEKVKPLREYYQQYAAYMRAWAEVERARLRHLRQEPGAAREHYRNASELHTSSRQWSYLSGNYSALAELENAEDLSLKEDFAGSIASFKEAIKLFSESREALKKHLDKIESPDEREMATRLIEATIVRKDFCAARSVLEEARLLDKRGEMSDASERYGQAAEMFRAILEKPAAGQSSKEIRLIITLADAWKAMSRAEAEASPELYEDAARLFEEAKEVSLGERTKNLTLGHSRFCKALGLGARFADESDPDLHRAATDNLESAARYYTKAGYDTAAEYARASKLLFDAYAQMSAAGKEADPRKKAKSYAMAEKLLEASAASYGKVGQSGRKEQVLKMLDRAKRERLLAKSLAEVFLAPDEASSTSAFSSPSFAQESAVGLDRFDYADVQATLIARPKTMNVGQDLVIEVELVNAGRGPAQLTKIDKVIPEGFDVVSEPEKCRVEDSYVNMKGRRLNALKTDDIKLVLRPSVHGEFQLRPRIMYLDESGKYKFCEPEPIDIRVKELGISGWLKGPERKGK